MKCDYCLSDRLKKIYRAPSTKRDIDICVCENCDLIQSWPRLSGIYKRSTKISGEADWGYIRYGKMQRLEDSMRFISQHIELKNLRSFLDIGANRGSFLKYLQKNLGKDKILCGVENDKFIYDEELKNLDGIRIENEKFEDTNLKEKFDFIHSSHTLEHVVSASAKMSKMKELVKDDGYVYLEVPNADSIKIKENIFEFFIDNHLFHFTQTTLEAYIKTFGFEIFAKQIEDYFLCYILKPLNKYKKDNFITPKTKVAIKVLNEYSINLKNSRKNLKNFSSKISKLSNYSKVGVWGLGRIFDIIRKNKGFDKANVKIFIDKNLAKFMDSLDGIQVSVPEDIKDKKIENLIICSELYFNDITTEAKNLDSKINCIHYKELF